MNDTHFAIVGAWVAAAIAELLHRRGEKKNSVYSRRASEVTMLAAIITLSIIAWNHPLPEIRFTSATASEPFAVRTSPIAVRRTEQPETRSPYVASIRLDSEVYHTRNCTKYSPKYVKEYQTEEEAQADGKRPCSFCIVTAFQGVPNASD